MFTKANGLPLVSAPLLKPSPFLLPKLEGQLRHSESEFGLSGLPRRFVCL